MNRSLPDPSAGGLASARLQTALARGSAIASAVLFLVAGAAYSRSGIDGYDLPKDALFGVLAPTLIALFSGFLWWRDLPAFPAAFRWLSLCAAGAALVASLASDYPDAVIKAWLRGASLLACAALGALTAARPSSARWLVVALLALGGLTAIVGLLQHFELERALPPAPFLGLVATDRPGSLFGHVNVASEVVAIGAAIGLGSILRGRVLLGLIGLLPSALFLLVGGSRAAWVALFVVSAVALPCARLLQHPKRSALALLALLALLVTADRLILVPGRGATAAVAPSERLIEAFRLNSGTQRERLVLWANTIAMIEESPLCGHGPGSWPLLYPSFARSRALHDPEAFSLLRQPERAHQDALQLAAELGIPAAIFLYGVALFALWRLARAEAPAIRALSRGLGAILLLSAFAFPLRQAVPAHAAVWIIGFGLALPRSAKPSRSGRLGGGVAIGWAVIAVLALAAWVARVEASEIAGRAQTIRLTIGKDAIASSDWVIAAERTRTMAPTDHRALATAADAHWRAGDPSSAEARNDRLLELRPHFANARLFASELARTGGDTERSFRELRAALALFPDSAELLFAGARLLHEWTPVLQRMRPEVAGMVSAEARRHAERAAALREYHPEARLLAAELALLAEDPARAIEHLFVAAQNTSLEPARLFRVALKMESEALAAFDQKRFGRGGTSVIPLWQRIAGLGGDKAPRAFAELALLPHLRQSGAPMQAAPGLEAVLARVEAALLREAFDLRLSTDRLLVQEALGRPISAEALEASIAELARADGLSPERQALWRDLESLRLRAFLRAHQKAGTR